MIQTNLHTKQKLVHRHRRQTYGYQKGKEGGKNEESGINICTLLYIRASLVAQRLKRLPAKRETWVQPLGREDHLEKAMATHSSILAWKIP